MGNAKQYILQTQGPVIFEGARNPEFISQKSGLAISN